MSAPRDHGACNSGGRVGLFDVARASCDAHRTDHHDDGAADCHRLTVPSPQPGSRLADGCLPRRGGRRNGIRGTGVTREAVFDEARRCSAIRCTKCSRATTDSLHESGEEGGARSPGGEKTHVESSAHAVWERERRESSQTRRSEPAASSDACRPAPDPAQVLPSSAAGGRGRQDYARSCRPRWRRAARSSSFCSAAASSGAALSPLSRRAAASASPCCAPTLLAVTVGIVDQERKRPPTRVHHRSGDQWWRRQVSEACLQGAVDRVPECEVIARDGVHKYPSPADATSGQHQPHLPVADPAAGPSHPCQQTLVGLDGAIPPSASGRTARRRTEAPSAPAHRQPPPKPGSPVPSQARR